MELYYQEKGAGQPLVLLHGNGEDSTYFKAQIEYFSARYRVIAIDTRGHGRSPRGTAPFTLKQFAEDLKSTLDELGVDKADFEKIAEMSVKNISTESNPRPMDKQDYLNVLNAAYDEVFVQ